MMSSSFGVRTFFMLTSVFLRPQTMEINLPPQETQVEVAESNLLTLRVLADGRIFWNFGIEAPQRIEFTQLRKFLIRHNENNPKLVTLIKVDRKSKYHHMVDVMDELQMAKVNRFSLAEIREVDIKTLQKASIL